MKNTIPNTSHAVTTKLDNSAFFTSLGEYILSEYEDDKDEASKTLPFIRKLLQGNSGTN